MIAFGALVALFLIMRPRGLLYERMVSSMRCLLRKMAHHYLTARRRQ